MVAKNHDNLHQHGGEDLELRSRIKFRQGISTMKPSCIAGYKCEQGHFDGESTIGQQLTDLSKKRVCLKGYPNQSPKPPAARTSTGHVGGVEPEQLRDKPTLAGKPSLCKPV